MSTIHESGLAFTFPKDWVVKRYDEHRFYNYLSGLGFKGVDMIAITPERKLILIEVKNYINRFPQDGIDPTETLIENMDSFSESFVQKFQDTFQLLQIVQKYFNRKKWFQWIANPIQSLLPFSFLISLDWGFWTVANQLLDQKEVELLLWLEVASTIPISQLENIHHTIADTFQDQLKLYTFHISHQKNNNTSIQVSFLES